MIKRFINNFKKARAEYGRNGFLKSSYRIAKKGFLRPLEARAGYYYYYKFTKRYTQNIIFIAAFAKSGSTWLANMLSGLPGFRILSPAEWRIEETDLYSRIFTSEFRHKLVVFKHHTWATQENLDLLSRYAKRYIITIRDPRDMIISSFYYIKNHPDHWQHDLISGNRLSIGEYIDIYLDSEAFSRDIIDWLRFWESRRDPENSIIIRYEDLIRDTFSEMKRCLDFLGFNIDSEIVKNILEKNSFQKQSGRSRGTEDRKSFLRRGISGEWKEVFTHEQKLKFSALADDFMLQLGYDKTVINQ
jgi:hypothetical protein